MRESVSVKCPVPQVRARSLYIQARNTRSSGANLGFAIFRRSRWWPIQAVLWLKWGTCDIPILKQAKAEYAKLQ